MITCYCCVMLKQKWNGDLFLPCCVKVEMELWSMVAMC